MHILYLNNRVEKLKRIIELKLAYNSSYIIIYLNMYAEVRSVGWVHRAAVVRKDGRSWYIMIYYYV